LHELERIADLLSKRNKIDFELSRIIGRPSQRGHLGEFIASNIFNIELEYSATEKGIDGVFLNEPLQGKTVNIKYYGKQEGILDIQLAHLADYYLVLTGPKSQPKTSRDDSRPLIISNVYLFDMRWFVGSLKKRKIKLGIATSVAGSYWSNAEIFPKLNNSLLRLSNQQVELLKLFGA